MKGGEGNGRLKESDLVQKSPGGDEGRDGGVHGQSDEPLGSDAESRAGTNGEGQEKKEEEKGKEEDDESEEVKEGDVAWASDAPHAASKQVGACSDARGESPDEVALQCGVESRSREQVYEGGWDPKRRSMRLLSSASTLPWSIAGGALTLAGETAKITTSVVAAPVNVVGRVLWSSPSGGRAAPEGRAAGEDEGEGEGGIVEGDGVDGVDEKRREGEGSVSETREGRGGASMLLVHGGGGEGKEDGSTGFEQQDREGAKDREGGDDQVKEDGNDGTRRGVCDHSSVGEGTGMREREVVGSGVGAGHADVGSESQCEESNSSDGARGSAEQEEEEEKEKEKKEEKDGIEDGGKGTGKEEEKNEERERQTRFLNLTVSELYESERRYLTGLQQLYSLFYLPLHSASLAGQPVMQPHHITAVFGHAGQLSELHSALCKDLEAAAKSNDRVKESAMALSRHAAGMRVYGAYVRGFPEAIAALKESQEGTTGEVSDFIAVAEGIMSDDGSEHRELAAGGGPARDGACTSLASLLIAPVQRLPRYVLLTRQILTLTPVDHQVRL